MWPADHAPEVTRFIWKPGLTQGAWMLMALSSFPDDRLPTPVAPAPVPRLTVHTVDDPRRGEVEAFIGRVYARRFGARVTGFAPTLVCLRDPLSQQIVAAAGYRRAHQGTLFLQRYLDAPIGQLLATHQSGAAVAPEGIFEVGHLAAERPGEGRRLIFLLAHHLAVEGALWVVSTLTEELRHLFVRLGVTPLALGRADAQALGDAASEWGSYYEHHPVVLAGQVQQALRLLERRQRSAGAAS
jgi:hypothetical protein